MQKDKRQHHGEHNAEFIDRGDFGDVARIQRLEIAEHESPVAAPERHRNRMFLPVSPAICFSAPHASTIPQAITRITVVRIAVARLELTPVTPTFARIAVSAAKNAERRA